MFSVKVDGDSLAAVVDDGICSSLHSLSSSIDALVDVSHKTIDDFRSSFLKSFCW